jgi:hypothetical protein
VECCLSATDTAVCTLSRCQWEFSYFYYCDVWPAHSRAVGDNIDARTSCSSGLGVRGDFNYAAWLANYKMSANMWLNFIKIWLLTEWNYHYFSCCSLVRSWHSSVGVVSDYRLVRSPVEAKDFSTSLCVQTSSEAHPASYPVCTRGHFTNWQEIFH